MNVPLPLRHTFILVKCSVLQLELESSMAGMIMLKPFAEAFIDCFQVCLSESTLIAYFGFPSLVDLLTNSSLRRVVLILWSIELQMC